MHKHLSINPIARTKRTHTVMLDMSKSILLDRISSLYEQVGISDPKNPSRKLVLTFIENLSKEKNHTSIDMIPISIETLPYLRFHCDIENDTGLQHPLTASEIHRLFRTDSQCPIGRKVLSHYNDFVTYIINKRNHQDERLLQLTPNRLTFFKRQLATLLHIPNPVFIERPSRVCLKDLPFCISRTISL